jgi:hypothetical protein
LNISQVNNDELVFTSLNGNSNANIVLYSFKILTLDALVDKLNEVITKMFSKQNYENDKYLQACLNAMNAIPIESLIQVIISFI